MGQRNMRNTNQMINLDHDQQAQFHLHPDPCPQPSRNLVLPVVEPITGFVPYHQSGSFENTVPYGMPQYNGIHQHPLAGNPGLGPATTSNYYNPYAVPPGSGVFPPQVNQGHQLVDGFGGAFKRKNGAGYLGNFQYCNSVAGPSSAGPLGPGLVGGETVLAHNPNNLIQGNYSVQGLIPASAPWLDQRFSGSGGDGGTRAWGQAPAISYIQGSGVNSGFTGMGNMVAGCYQETAANSISTNLQPHAPPVYPQGHPQSLHYLPQPVQGSFYPQIPGTSYGLPRNSALHANMNTFQVGTEVGPSYVGPAPSSVAVYHPSNGRALLPAATPRHHALPRFNLLPADEVALLDIPGHYEIGNAIDNHREMRMDVDSMSYEELLALEEHIGVVRVGLSEDTISNHLKTKTHIAAADSVELEDRETDFCAICQTNYEDQEKIGTLECGHEYHVDCVKKWLIIKNICPICKSSALTTKRKDSTREG